MADAEHAAWVDQISRWLDARGAPVGEVDRLAAALPQATPAERDDMLAAFGRLADALPDYLDSDYGAVRLEQVADACAGEPAVWLLRAALARAEFYVRCATAGGEALARKLDMQRIADKLGRAEAGMT